MLAQHLIFILIQIIRSAKGVIIHATLVAVILLRLVVAVLQIQAE